jgi:hypothetical protein
MRFWIAPQAKAFAKLEFGRENVILENVCGATIVLVAYAVSP